MKEDHGGRRLHTGAARDIEGSERAGKKCVYATRVCNGASEGSVGWQRFTYGQCSRVKAVADDGGRVVNVLY